MRLEHVRRLGFPVHDSVEGLVYAGGFFVAYALADVITSSLAGFESADVGRSLLVASLGSNLPLALVVVIALAVVVWRRPDRWLSGWPDLERGPELRWVALPCIGLMAWQGSLYQYNYLLDRSHPTDRLLVVALAAAAIGRPIFLVPFVLQARVVAHQFTLPFGTSAAQNIDELLLIVLLALAGAHLMYVLTGRDDSAPVALVMFAAVATAFFVPGRGKIQLNWLANEDLANLASSGYAVGWLGQTGGGLARLLARVTGTVGFPLRLAVVLFELAAGVVVVNHRWFRWWLPATIGFHVVNFLLLGFWFLTWVVLEVVLVIVLHRRTLRPWLDRNLSLGRAAMTGVAVVVLGPLLFHPPGLAWLDSPVAYGYQVEVVGESGRRYVVPLDSFAPFNQELTFTRLQLGDTRPATGAYGVIVSAERLRLLQQLDGVSEVAGLEEPFGPEDIAGHEQTEQFLQRFMAYANRRAVGDNRTAEGLAVIKPIPKFWTDAPPPHYDFQEPILALEVFRLTSLRLEHDDGTQEFQHQRISAVLVSAT